jgi:ammonium transporter, Amt family
MRFSLVAARTPRAVMLIAFLSIALLGIGPNTSGQAQEPDPPIAGATAPPEPETTVPPGDVRTTEPPTEESPWKADVDAAANAGHTAWMLVSCALVLFMTAPGLAMFYGGLVRKKNVLSVMMQCMFLMGLMTVLWALYGYSLSFGGAPAEPEDPDSAQQVEEYESALKTFDAHAPYIGSHRYIGMQNVQREWNEQTGEAVDHMEGLIPRPVHMLFQGMFFIITPALICGAFAERMKFSTMVVFMVLWGTIVYCPLCHWVWGGGLLAYGEDHAILGGALDFAGGTVVHISSGVSALVCALLLGRRLGMGSEPMPPHNLTYTVLGAAMLWVGWFGFNAGSQLGSDGVAAQAFMNTHFSAAAGTIAWAGAEWILRGKPSALGAASGAVAGLVCITPAAGFVQPIPAIAMGAAAGVVCFWSCAWLKNKFNYDDSLDAFGVHGVGGTLGAVLTGVFATRSAADTSVVGPDPLGLVDGNVNLLLGQIAAVLVTVVLSIVVTFVLLKVLDALMGLRVTKAEEQQGLDLNQHGEEGYIFL